MNRMPFYDKPRNPQLSFVAAPMQ